MKSRIWDNQNQCFYNEDFFVCSEGRVFQREDGHLHEKKNCVVELCVDLKTTAGNDVYAGDILYDAHRDEYMQVVFIEGCFVARYLGTDQNLADVLADNDVSIEGNIHQTPELLNS